MDILNKVQERLMYELRLPLDAVKVTYEYTQVIAEYSHSTNCITLPYFFLKGGRLFAKRHERTLYHEYGHSFREECVGDYPSRRFIDLFGDIDNPYCEYGWVTKHFIEQNSNFVSTYARTHPEEDFAETFAAIMMGTLPVNQGKKLKDKVTYMEGLISRSRV